MIEEEGEKEGEKEEGEKKRTNVEKRLNKKVNRPPKSLTKLQRKQGHLLPIDFLFLLFLFL